MSEPAENYIQIRQDICSDCLQCPGNKDAFFFTHNFDNYDLPDCFDSLNDAIAAAKSELDHYDSENMPDPDEMAEFRIIDYAGNPVCKFEQYTTKKNYHHPDYGVVCDLYWYRLVNIKAGED